MGKWIALVAMLIIPAIVVAEPLDSVVAVVNDGVITATELNDQVELLRKQLTAKGMALPSEQVLKKQVLQHLIDVNLQLQMAKQNGITIDNTELNEAINKIAESNHLTLTKLREALANEGLDWKEYRENVRKEILIARVQQKAVTKEITISPKQVEEYLQSESDIDKSKYTYHLRNIVVPLPEEPTPEQLSKAKKKANDLLAKIKKGEDFGRLALAESRGEFALEGGDLGERYLAELPEVFAAQVVTMKKGEVAGPLRTGNGFQIIQLMAIGGTEQKHEVAKTRVRHILIKQDASMTMIEAKNQANNVYQQLKSGKDFARMAKQYSADAVSAVKGGDLGWVGPGELVHEFEKAMDNLAINHISKPIKSGFGWHIIQVLERKKIDDSVGFKKQQVKQFLQQRKFMEAVQNWQQHMRTDAYIKILDKQLA